MDKQAVSPFPVFMLNLLPVDGRSFNMNYDDRFLFLDIENIGFAIVCQTLRVQRLEWTLMLLFDS